MDNAKREKRRQSIIYGALTGSLGIFICKALGLIYISPLDAMAGDDLVFYSVTYTVYEFLWSLSTSGIPYAIAALVAKYMITEDYDLTLRVRKLSLRALFIIGLTISIGVFLFSGVIVHVLAGDESIDYQTKYRICLMLLSGACLSVPLLGGYRSFYQGLRHFEVYSFSQVLEQIVRICFLLAGGACAVYLFHASSVWAVYFAIIAMTVSAVATIGFFLVQDKKQIPYLQEMASKQERVSHRSDKDILKEILLFAAPFLLQSILDHSFGLVNLRYLIDGLKAHGYSRLMADRIYTIINFNSSKLTAIPSVLGAGFAAAMIPHMAQAHAVRDDKMIDSNFRKSFASSGFLSIPMVVLMMLFSREIYFFMFGFRNLDLGSNILSLSLMSFFGWILMIISNPILLALDMRWHSLVLFGIRLLITIICTFPVVSAFGYQGLFYYELIMYLVFVGIDWILVRRKYKINILATMWALLKEFICCVPMVLVILLLKNGHDVIPMGRIMTLIISLLRGAAGAVFYAVFAFILKLPQDIFGLSPKAAWEKIKRKLHLSK